MNLLDANQIVFFSELSLDELQFFGYLIVFCLHLALVSTLQKQLISLLQLPDLVLQLFVGLVDFNGLLNLVLHSLAVSLQSCYNLLAVRLRFKLLYDLLSLFQLFLYRCVLFSQKRHVLLTVLVLLPQVLQLFSESSAHVWLCFVLSLLFNHLPKLFFLLILSFYYAFQLGAFFLIILKLFPKLKTFIRAGFGHLLLWKVICQVREHFLFYHLVIVLYLRLCVELRDCCWLVELHCRLLRNLLVINLSMHVWLGRLLLRLRLRRLLQLLPLS